MFETLIQFKCPFTVFLITTSSFHRISNHDKFCLLSFV